jgi:hypothetical protein
MLEESLIEYLIERGFKYGIEVLKRTQSPDLLVKINGQVKKAEVEVCTSKYRHSLNYADLVIAWKVDKPLPITLITIDHDDFESWSTEKRSHFETNSQHRIPLNNKEPDFLPILLKEMKKIKDEIVEKLEFLRTRIYKVDKITFYRDVFPMFLEDRNIITLDETKKIFKSG